MIIDPVNFDLITKHEVYIVNPQNIKYCHLNKQSLHLRLHCSLKAHHFSINPIAGLSYIQFICVDKHHQHRFCTDKNNLLKVSHTQLVSTQCSSGNLLVHMHTAACHACGNTSTHCWQEYTGHYVCPKCVTLGMKSPYLYGVVKNKCCEVNGCGDALYLYSEVPEELYERVLGIYEKYKTA